jgi:hypothetical protein
MHTRLRPVLLSFAAVAVTVSSAAPALASHGPAQSPSAVHSDLSAWSVAHTPNPGLARQRPGRGVVRVGHRLHRRRLVRQRG